MCQTGDKMPGCRFLMRKKTIKIRPKQAQPEQIDSRLFEGRHMPLFECIELSKAFGGLQAVDNLTFHVDQHEIVSIIGPNGAGKTTVLT